jgi:hypothetical protein
MLWIPCTTFGGNEPTIEDMVNLLEKFLIVPPQALVLTINRKYASVLLPPHPVEIAPVHWLPSR